MINLNDARVSNLGVYLVLVALYDRVEGAVNFGKHLLLNSCFNYFD